MYVSQKVLFLNAALWKQREYMNTITVCISLALTVILVCFTGTFWFKIPLKIPKKLKSYIKKFWKCYIKNVWCWILKFKGYQHMVQKMWKIWANFGNVYLKNLLKTHYEEKKLTLQKNKKDEQVNSNNKN